MAQRFTVPQFIDVEDKILGPVTVRQFVILLGAALICFIGYALFTFDLFVVWSLIWIGLCVILAFVRINGMPFHYFLLNMIQTVQRASTRVWNKELSNAQIRALAFKKAEIKKVEEIPVKAPLSFSTLSELSLIADTGGSYAGERVLEEHEVKLGGMKSQK
ncbi:MAG: PrgI family protein [Parcubacteria group bacterium]|nr:PrgI family protein [Parcubacteria group bacterium]